MRTFEGFSGPIELTQVPEWPGVCIIHDEDGNVLQIAESQNIRRRIGSLLDSDGATCVHGPKIYEFQQSGRSVFVQWKLTPKYRAEKQALVRSLKPVWKQKGATD